jgi:hypothetical protein
MAEFMVRGGANVGWGWQGWPFAKLIASENNLRLWVFRSPGFSFAPDDVICLRRYLLAGIQIVHNRSDYQANIVFYARGDIEELLARIRVAGFSPRAPAASALPGTESQPVKSAYAYFALYIIAAIIIFAILLHLRRQP